MYISFIIRWVWKFLGERTNEIHEIWATTNLNNSTVRFFVWPRTVYHQFKINSYCFQLMGLGLFIPGIVLQTNIDFVSDEIKPVLDQVSVTGIALGDVVKNLGIGFIIVGVFVFLVAVLGLMGACCKSKCLLTIVSSVYCVQGKMLNRFRFNFAPQAVIDR